MINNVALVISNLRKKRGWSQSDLEQQSGVSREMISKYERGKAIPSILAAQKIAKSFEVSLDYLMGEGLNAEFSPKTIKRVQEIDRLDKSTQEKLFFVIDTFIRDAKTRQAYS